MNWEKELFDDENEKPLDSLIEGYSNTSIFRTIGFIGDSLSSGEFESRDEEGNPGWHDYYEYSLAVIPPREKLYAVSPFFLAIYCPHEYS